MIAYLLRWAILLALCCQRVSAAVPYKWKDKEKYYFPDIDGKLSEIITGSCRLSHKTADHPNDVPSVFYPKLAADFIVLRFAVEEIMSSWWRSIPSPKQMRVEPWLCDVVFTKKNPIFNNTGCQLPDYMSTSAPRCQTSYLKWICDSSRMDIMDSSSSSRFILPESNHATSFLPPAPFLLIAKYSFVTLCGQIISSCGIVHTTANCKARSSMVQGKSFQKKCNLKSFSERMVEKLQPESTVKACSDGAPFSSNVTYIKKIFLVAEVDDTYIYHIHLEIMPRIIYHLQFLLDNPDIKILIGCDSKKNAKDTASGLRQGLNALRPLLQQTGLSIDRFVVHQHVYSDLIYLPMEGGCQDPVYNTWQILHMRKFYMLASGLDGNAVTAININDRHRPLRMLLLKRSSNSKHTRNGHDLVRQWSDAFAVRVQQALQQAFSPTFDVELASDRNQSLMSCHACQVQLFHNTDVLVGVHGAGLANMIYMKPNSAVVELCPYGNDGRCLLGGGPFSRTAAVMAHDYMIHHPPYEEFAWMTDTRSSEFNITRFVLHIRSFLISVGKLSH